MKKMLLSFAVAGVFFSASALADRSNGNGKSDRPIRAIEANDYFEVNTAAVDLGQALFFDKELSGNRNISCSTCHNPMAGTSDGLSINLGEGASGFSVARSPGQFPPLDSDPLSRGARNAPALFDLGAKDYTFMMHDGRFGVDEAGNLFSPAGEELPSGFGNVLEVISIFAFTDSQEMLGQPHENDIAFHAQQSGSSFGPVWDKLVERVLAVPEYQPLIEQAYPELVGNLSDFSVVHIGKAIADFQNSAYRTPLDNRFDRFLSGEASALTREERAGYRLFTGKAGCNACHNGPFLTDQEFHAIAVPQIGPGFGNGSDGFEDFGRENETGDISDRYKFRTPGLRNISLTGPWGHDGAFASLRAMVEHHLDAEVSLRNYDKAEAVLPSRQDLDALDFVAHNDGGIVDAIASQNELAPTSLSEQELDQLMAFLYALTPPENLDLRYTVPKSVPSGLTLAD